jgi:hypothetical protein
MSGPLAALVDGQLSHDHQFNAESHKWSITRKHGPRESPGDGTGHNFSLVRRGRSALVRLFSLT